MSVDAYVCPRCATPARGASTCEECGFDLDSEARLPTAEEYDAGGVEAAAEQRAREAAVEANESAWASVPVREFKSPRVRGQVLQLWLVGGIFVDVAIGVLSFIHVGLIDDTKAGSAKFNELVASEDRLAFAYIGLVVVFLITAVFFISWFYRAYKNLPALGCRPRHRVGWTIGAWFIPIVSWIIPKRITNDIWRGTVASSAPEWPWQLRTVPLWVHVWWALFIIGNLLGNISSSVYGEGDDLDQMRASTIIDVVSTPIYVASAILTWLLVDRISKAQEAAASGSRPRHEPLDA